MTAQHLASKGRRKLNFKLLYYQNGQMIIDANIAGHKQIVEKLQAFRKFGTVEIEVEVYFITFATEKLQEVLPDWTASPLDVAGSPYAVAPAAFERPLANHTGTRVARAQLTIEKESPVRLRILDKALGAKLLDGWQADPRTNLCQTPKVKAFNGRTIFISDTSQKPFVVGLKKVKPEVHQPKIRVVNEGTTLQLRPVAEESGSMHLDFAITNSEICDVETFTFTRTTGGPPNNTVQIPSLSTARTEGGATLKPGEWLLLGGLDCKNNDANTKVIAISWKAFGRVVPPKRSSLP